MTSSTHIYQTKIKTRILKPFYFILHTIEDLFSIIITFDTRLHAYSA